MRTYLDYNATAPLRPRARDAMLAALEQVGNPSSVHQEGRTARALLEEAREEVARLCNAEAKNVIFTSGGSEANQFALQPFWQRKALGLKDDAATHERHLDCLYVSAIEHPSVLAGGGFSPQNINLLSVTSEGVVDIMALRDMLAGSHQKDAEDGKKFLVSVMYANNETGAIQPINEIAQIVHDYGGLLHCDCVQAAGKLTIDINALAADMITLSAHKLGGPTGVGALVLSDDQLTCSKPLIRGGGQERNRRAGTENTGGIAGFGAAAREANEDLKKGLDIGALRSHLEDGLVAIDPDIEIFSKNVPRLSNTVLFAAKGLSAETQVIALDLKGVAISAGSACSSGKVERSHVLDAMGVSHDLSEAALRVSVGWQSENEDIDHFLNSWEDVYRRKKANPRRPKIIKAGTFCASQMKRRQICQRYKTQLIK